MGPYTYLTLISIVLGACFSNFGKFNVKIPSSSELDILAWSIFFGNLKVFEYFFILLFEVSSFLLILELLVLTLRWFSWTSTD